MLIVVNLGLVASSHAMQPPTFKELQLNTDIVMNSLYTCELLIALDCLQQPVSVCEEQSVRFLRGFGQ